MFRFFVACLLVSFSSLGCTLQERCLEWDKAVNAYYMQHPEIKSPYPFRVLLCLYGTQYEAYRQLSVQTNLETLSFDNLNLAVCRYFLPSFDFPIKANKESIPDQLVEKLLKKIDAFALGKKESSFTTICVQPKNCFCVPPPPPEKNQDFWRGQVEKLRFLRKNMTEKETKLAHEWKLLAGPDGKNWPNILIDYFQCIHPSNALFFESRATLLEAIHDSFMISFHFKEEYDMPRPFERDPSIKPLFRENSPSYPSGHAAIAGACNVILNHFFPEHRCYWTELADELASSRLWAGVHFPIDVLEGRILGEEVGRAYITKCKFKKSPFELDETP